MSFVYRCEVCGTANGPDPKWRIQRRGDAVVSWACSDHLDEVCQGLQREWERTELQVRLFERQ